MFLPFVFVAIFLLKALYFFMVSKFAKNLPICRGHVKKAKERVKEFPGDVIRLFIELCLDISVCGSIEILMR